MFLRFCVRTPETFEVGTQNSASRKSFSPHARMYEVRSAQISECNTKENGSLAQAHT